MSFGATSFLTSRRYIEHWYRNDIYRDKLQLTVNAFFSSVLCHTVEGLYFFSIGLTFHAVSKFSRCVDVFSTEMCDVGGLRVGEDFDYSLLSCDTAQPETIVNHVLEVLHVTVRGQTVLPKCR